MDEDVTAVGKTISEGGTWTSFRPGVDANEPPDEEPEGWVIPEWDEG